MNAQEIVGRCTSAAEEFDQHERSNDGLQVIESLCGGLTLIRDCVYDRVHADVEFRVGIDSMIQPLSEERSERLAKQEIDIFQVVVAAEAARARGYVADGNWFRDWLALLRLGGFDKSSRTARRISYYISKSPKDQRLAFGNILDNVLPEASRSPLILLRILPLAVQIATALAFGKTTDAQDWRHDQADILASLHDCHLCRGKLLENGEQCSMCGNPLWTYNWLNSTDG